LKSHHGHGVKLLQTRHCLQKQNNNTPSLDRLDCPREQVGRDRLVILQNEHSKCLTEDLGRVLVVGVSDIRNSDKELKGVLIVGFPYSALNVPLDLGFSLLSVARVSRALSPAVSGYNKAQDDGSRGEAEIFLVAP